MNKGNRSRVMGLVVVLVAAGWSLPAAWASDDGFTLPAVVPQDVFLCVAERNNPERDFLDQYWGEVWAALKESGIGTDVMALITAVMNEDQQAELERLKERASKLLAGVDWGQMDAKEFVFAERMPIARVSGGNINVGPPDMVWLFRGTAEGAGRNFEGLAAILEAIAEEVNKAAEDEMLQVERSERMGAAVATMRTQWVPFTLDVARSGDVIAIALGETILDETLGLLAGKGTKKPITSDPRFGASFKKLPSAEDMMFFFDVQRFLGDIRVMAKELMAAMGTEKHEAVTNAYQNAEAVALNRQAVEAYKKGDHPKALEFIQKANQVDPTDSVIMYNLACFQALAGHKEEALGWLEKSVNGGFNDPKLISRDPDLETLRDDPRYDAALAKAKSVVAGCQSEQTSMIQQVIGRILDAPGILDHIASIEYTDGYATHTESLYVLVPDAAGKPFYGVVGERKPLTDFDRYVPQEAVSFSVGSGIDLGALYKFIEDSFHEAGPPGEKMWAQWNELQQQWELDVAKDVIGWIDGQTVTITMGRGMAATSVLMVKVTDEAVAREKVAAAIEFVGTAVKQFSSGNPMLAMYVPRTAPLTHEKLEGFQTVSFAMQPLVWGVADGHLIFSNSADSVALCLETAGGEHPSIRKNAQVMSEALLPKGEFSSVTFTDEREFGQQLSMILGMVSMMGMGIPMVIPDPDLQQAVAKIVGIVGKLSPVAAKIDFYKSSASYTTFDGQAWHEREVTHYRSPAERTAIQSR